MQKPRFVFTEVHRSCIKWVRATPRLVKALLETPSPRFYINYLQLYHLSFTVQCYVGLCFRKLRTCLSSKQLLVLYDLARKLVVLCHNMWCIITRNWCCIFTCDWKWRKTRDRSTKWSCRCPSPFTAEQIKLWTDKDPVLARVKEQC